MKFRLINLLAAILLLAACGNQEKGQTVTVTNPLAEPVTELTCQLSSPALMQSIAELKTSGFRVLDGENEIPYQLIEQNNKPVALLIQTDFAPNEEKTLTIKAGKGSSFPQKTQAEISVKENGEWVWVTKSNGNEQFEYQGGNWKNVSSVWVDEKHTDHSFDIRYEGPGWESDKIGYRFYLDWRNAVDIFGKKVDTLVLHQVGLDGFDSYHEMSDWGVDVLKVGNALGIGTIACWDGENANRVALTDSIYSEVTYSGVLESKLTTNYFGWEYANGKTDLTSELSIRAGSYFTKNRLTTSNPTDNISTGLIRFPNTTVLQSSEEKGDWAYLATFGVQTLEEDHMGMAIFYKKADLVELTDDKYSHVVVLKPENNQLTYFYGAAWEQDASKMDRIEKFETFLKKQLALFNAGLMD
ncbi:DUF4861 family protein [Gaoshiqia sp. Z1-71]|uniref:DUF4861 family protein n=1 Tax=Gaoshiqia hydrogeniformans TaxID=3290090 RepID=UPI003BF7C0AA